MGYEQPDLIGFEDNNLPKLSTVQAIEEAQTPAAREKAARERRAARPKSTNPTPVDNTSRKIKADPSSWQDRADLK